MIINDKILNFILIMIFKLIKLTIKINFSQILCLIKKQGKINKEFETLLIYNLNLTAISFSTIYQNRIEKYN